MWLLPFFKTKFTAASLTVYLIIGKEFYILAKVRREIEEHKRIY